MTREGIAYQPALDGVRGVSVIAVLLFHGGVAGFGGGYLGVSVFFTLSGFLITSLMISEQERTGRVAIGAFYARRARRLLPASIACITAVAVAAATTNWFDGVAALRRDLTGAMLQVANWVFLAGGDSYQQLLARTAGRPSPVEHYWSLAIEEQFYWLFPLAFVVLHRIARDRRRATVFVSVATVAAIVAAPVIAVVWGADAAYWATPARAAEILTGVLAAFVVQGRQVPRRWAGAAPVALLALAVAVVLFPSDRGPAYEGALPLVGIASALLIVGLQAPGPVRDALAMRPLVGLGRISYGVYLFHWPVYVVLDHQRTGLGTGALLIVRLAVTLAIALLSFVVIEHPIRTRLRWRPARTGGVALASTALAALAVVVLVDPGRGSYWRSAAAADEAAIDTVSSGTLPPLVEATAPVSAVVLTTIAETSTAAQGAPSSPLSSTPTPTSTPASGVTDEGPAATATAGSESATTSTTETPLPQLSRPMRVVVAGDSTAEATGFGLAAWAVAHPDLAQVSIDAAEGCGFLRDGEYDAGGWTTYTSRCESWLDDDLPASIASLQPDVVMLMTSSWDVLDRRWDDGPTLTPLDPEYRDRLLFDFTAVTDRLLAAGAAHVVFVREPVPVPLWGFGGEQAQSDPARHAVIAATMDAIAASHAGRVTVVDLATWLDTADLTDDHDARPDGVHWTPDVALRIADEFLGEQLLRAALGQ